MNTQLRASDLRPRRKPAPQLLSEKPGRGRQWRDLAWLASLVARAAPLPCALWAAVTRAEGLLVPLELLLTKVFVDALAARLAGNGGERASGLNLATFEHQAYYDQLIRVMSNIDSRGPQLLGQWIGLARTVPPLLGYAVALLTIAPALLFIFALTPSFLRAGSRCYLPRSARN